MHHVVVDGPSANHAEAAHPARIVVSHQLLAADRMNQRRLKTVRQRAQKIGGAAATGAAHDHQAAGLVDPEGDFGDVGFSSGELGTAALEAVANGEADVAIWVISSA